MKLYITKDEDGTFVWEQEPIRSNGGSFINSAGYHEELKDTCLILMANIVPPGKGEMIVIDVDESDSSKTVCAVDPPAIDLSKADKCTTFTKKHR